MAKAMVRVWDAWLARHWGLPSAQIDEFAAAQAELVRPIEDDRNLPPTAAVPHDDFTPLARILLTERPQKVLELGTGHGNTTANICALVDAHVITVNALPHQMSGRVVTFALTQDDIGRVYRKHGYADRVTQIFESTIAFDPDGYLPRDSVDLAIIDACHDSSFVTNDFFKVLPSLRGNAVVLFHDTHPSMERHLAGSYRACMQLRACGFDIRHITGTWWGFWRKPREPRRRRWRASLLRIATRIILRLRFRPSVGIRRALAIVS